jgi:hypothetical protein
MNLYTLCDQKEGIHIVTIFYLLDLLYGKMDGLMIAHVMLVLHILGVIFSYGKCFFILTLFYPSLSSNASSSTCN